MKCRVLSGEKWIRPLHRSGFEQVFKGSVMHNKNGQ